VFLAASVAVLLVAAALRLYRLPELPLGFHYDEAANGILAGEIGLKGKTPIFISAYTGKEVLFFYWAALWVRMLGATPLALRLSAATIGIITVAVTAWAVRALFREWPEGQWIALLTAAFLATSFWHLLFSRYGFRAVSQPLMQALTVAALWRGLHSPSRPPARKPVWLILAGFFCGLTGYTYLAARAFPLPLAVTFLSVLIAGWRDYRVRLKQFSIFVLVALLTLAPLLYYWATHPGSFITRAQQVAARSRAEAWGGIIACARMFFCAGDPYIRFNIPYRPLFGAPEAVLFALGLVTLIAGLRPAEAQRRCRNLPPATFLLSNLIFMVLPSALATGDITPSNLRSIGLLPFIYVFPALGLWQLIRWKGTWSGRTAHVCYGVVLLILLSVATPVSGHAYFSKWASSAGLYYAADGDLVDVAAYLNRTDLSGVTPYVASVHYRHPTLAFLSRKYGMLHWLTGGRTVVLPARGDALLVFPRSASDDLAWVESMLPAEKKTDIHPGPDGGPAFRAYRINSVAPPLHTLSADLGHVAILRGYEVSGVPRSGGVVEIAVWWEVLNRPERGDYIPFARLSDRWGFAWGEVLPFHYPSEQWQPGELVVDHLSVPVQPGAPPGEYTVRFGFYAPGAAAPMPVFDEQGGYAGTYVELPVRLSQAATPLAIESLGISRRLDVPIGGIRLLGANLDTLSARPGEPLYLTLFWQATDSRLPDCSVSLTSGDITLYRGAPVHGTYPTSLWSAGEVIVDRYNPLLPRDMPPGEHTLHVSVCGATVEVGTFVTRAISRTFAIPPLSHPLRISLGGQVVLLGYDLSRDEIAPGEKLLVTLYWQALREMDENYTVFVHLVAPDGTMAGQRDSWPLNGSYPTSLWLGGEVVTDTYEIEVGATVPPGEYLLETGMYIAETGKRLGVGDGSRDAVVLQPILVTGH